MLPLTYKMMNKSAASRGAENANAVDVDKLRMIEQRYQNKAEYYAERLRLYLAENDTLFPEYQNPASGLDVINPQNQYLFGGFYLGEDDVSLDQAAEH